MFTEKIKKCRKLKDKARLTWNCLRVNRDYWTEEVSHSKAKSGSDIYHIKFVMSRFAYNHHDMIRTGFVSETASQYETSFKKGGKNTFDHILGSSLVGECTLDNADFFLNDEKGFDEFFQLYLHSILVTWITREENNKLAQLRGKFLTKDKYNEVGIILRDRDNNIVELPAPPKILTEWEIKKFGLKDSGYQPKYTRPKKLIQFV